MMNPSNQPIDGQIGDVLYTRNRDGGLRTKGCPIVNHRLYQVTRRTATQATVVHFGPANVYSTDTKVRLADGRVIGQDYTYMLKATDDIIAQHEREVALLKRYRQAARVCEDLLDRPMHMLGLNTEQIEALAAAWATIKAMPAPKP